MKAQRKTRTGRVISTKMEKTDVVRVEFLRRHPMYKKTVRQVKKYLVHDEKGLATAGDEVVIMECRPISKRKCWRVVEVLHQGVPDMPPNEAPTQVEES